MRLLNNEESELKGQTETARVNAEEAKKNLNNIESELEKYNEQLRLHQKELAKSRSSIQKINDLSAQIQSKIAKFDTLIENLNGQICGCRGCVVCLDDRLPGRNEELRDSCDYGGQCLRRGRRGKREVVPVFAHI